MANKTKAAVPAACRSILGAEQKHRLALNGGLSGRDTGVIEHIVQRTFSMSYSRWQR